MVSLLNQLIIFEDNKQIQINQNKIGTMVNEEGFIYNIHSAEVDNPHFCIRFPWFLQNIDNPRIL